MAAANDEPVIRGARLRIFLISFALLFFELLCIRWIPAYVRYLSYFTNFILLASFLASAWEFSPRGARRSVSLPSRCCCWR